MPDYSKVVSPLTRQNEKRVSSDTDSVVLRMPNQKQRLAVSHALMRAGQWRRMLRTKGARRAHRTILSQGRQLCVEARAAKAAKRERELNTGKQWRYGNTQISE